MIWNLPSGIGDGNLTEAEALLKPFAEKFPNVSSSDSIGIFSSHQWNLIID